MLQLLLLVLLGGLIVFVVRQAGVVARSGTALKSHAVGRALVVLIFGIVTGVGMNRGYSRQRSGGKEASLEMQETRFDSYIAKPHAVIPGAILGVVFVGGAVGAYELIVLGISALCPALKKQGAA